MKYILILSLISASAFAGETWNKTKSQVNEAAEGTDRVTRETIQKGKDKWSQHQEEERMEDEKEERAEYERLKKKYGEKEKI